MINRYLHHAFSVVKCKEMSAVPTAVSLVRFWDGLAEFVSWLALCCGRFFRSELIVWRIDRGTDPYETQSEFLGGQHLQNRRSDNQCCAENLSPSKRFTRQQCC